MIPTTTPISSTPVLNPTSNPDSATSPMTMSPMTAVPVTTTTRGGGSWCVASQSASQSALQVGLDYACGYGGADCAAIQPGGGCYNPNTIHAHASYAFNSYFGKNPVPSSCNFGGAAVTTSIDPSSETCQYQSTSITSSVLNTTNSNGSNVFGAVPYNPSPPSAAAIRLKPAGQTLFTAVASLVLLGRSYN
ncbi:Detected protein of confused Function [Hibiscus syriacus]|uniref:Detected protein of confused Function n=1 Tax=Hibiscus syriacus TaxID=106335 RepID=A0A6A2WC35_HIBSY|nr:Detected protein of confused Function [Hibiscus syriacus]